MAPRLALCPSGPVRTYAMNALHRRGPENFFQNEANFAARGLRSSVTHPQAPGVSQGTSLSFAARTPKESPLAGYLGIHSARRVFAKRTQLAQCFQQSYWDCPKKSPLARPAGP